MLDSYILLTKILQHATFQSLQKTEKLIRKEVVSPAVKDFFCEVKSN